MRLPTTARPQRYSADLRMTPGEDNFSGRIDIELEISRPVQTVWMHAKSLRIDNAVFHLEGRNEPARVTPAANDLIGVTSANMLPAGHASLEISYWGEISRTLTDGAFAQRQGDDWYIFTKFEPVTARRVFPCFDEPSFKVPWRLTLRVPKDLKAFSNTQIVTEQADDGGMKTVSFGETKPLPSYLVAFAVGPFDVVETAPVGRNRRPSRIIVPRGRGPEAAYAASVTPKLIEMLEDYFGSPYPYEKLDQIVVPLTTAWGAMENAGLIAYGDFLLSPQAQDSELRQRVRVGAMEHEMSHQWFGDLVTTAWWNDIWLNEAFASWLSTKLLNEWKPEWNLKADAARSLSVMRADSLTTARKIRQPIEAPGDIGNAFDGITYGKGEAVIGMFENYMGAEKFQSAIRMYLERHAWGNATSADLFAALDTVSGQRIGAAFSTFLDQVGYPLVTLKLGCLEEYMGRASHSSVFLESEQHRFLPVGSPGDANAIWQVPVCFSWGDEEGTHRECKLVTKAADSFTLTSGRACPTWFFADSDAAGYYAVSYDERSLGTRVRKGLPHLKPEESAAALRNAQVMFWAGAGDIGQELESVSDFSRSPDAGLARQAAGTIETLGDFVTPQLRPNYARLIRALYGPQARELGWKPKPGESQEVRLLRMEIVPLVATLGEDRELSAEAGSLAHEWIKSHQALEPDMVEPVLSAAAWNGDRGFFDLLVDEIKKDRVQRERSWMIGALASFRDPSLTRARLGLILGSGIDPRELQNTLFNAPPYAREIVWQFARQNFDRLNALLPGARGIPFGALLPLTASGFCDASHAQALASFFESRMSALPGGARNLANAEERIRLCRARVQASGPAIASFLGKQ